MNIEAHRPLIEQLKPLLKEPDFDELFARIAQKEPKQVQFLIKMELKRLAEPCIRLIDCRPRAGDHCVPIQAESVTHYLDPQIQEVYEQELKLYGHYSMGVYEAVIQKEKALKSASKSKPMLAEELTTADENPDVASSKFSVPLLKLGYCVKRKTERLILSAKVSAFLSDGRSIAASISDFSVHGLKLRLPASLHLPSKSELEINLNFMRQPHDQEPEHWLGAYRLVAIHKQNTMYQWVRLERIDTDSVLTERIQHYFDKQKQRLTIDTDSAVESVQARGFEDAYFRQMSGAPILIGQTEQGLKAVSTLRTEANHELYNYWRSNDGKLRLSDLFTVARLRELSANTRQGKTTLLYCFSHLAAGRVNYFVATNDELDACGLKELFFTVGSHRDSWRVFSLTIHSLCLEDAEKTLGLPEDILKQLGLNRPMDRQTRAQLEKLKGVVMMFDITSRMGSHAYKSLYNKPSQDANQLKQFQISHCTPPLTEESFEFRHTRSEARYLYRTPVTVRMTQRAATGTTVNISVKGLQIQLSKSLPVAEGDQLMVSLPKLQELDGKIKLTDIPYRVVGMNQSQSLLSLKVHGETVHPSVIPFMKQLLKLNGHKLKQAAEQICLPEYVTGLRNMLVSNLPHPAVYISRQDKRMVLTHVATGHDESGILSLLQQLHQQTGLMQDNGVNLTALLKGDRFNQLLLRPLRVLQEGQAGCYGELLLSATRDEEDKITKVDCLYLMDTTDPEQARSFVQAALNKSDFFALRISLSRYGDPSFTSINKELHYISDYAAHKAQKLEQELYSLIGVGELVDITDEILIRLAITQPALADLPESA